MSAERLSSLPRCGVQLQTSKGLAFISWAILATLFQYRFAVNLPRKAKLTQPVRRFNHLLDPQFTGGSCIYVRNIYRRDINSPFSYKLWDFDMAPDRHGAKDERQMWLERLRVLRHQCCVQRDHAAHGLQTAAHQKRGGP